MRAAYRAEVVDGCVRCRWHGSEFRLTDGKVIHGPAAASQPAWRVQVGERVQVRSAQPDLRRCLLGTLREDGRSRQEFFVLTGVND